MTDVDEDVRKLSAAFYAEKARNPDVVPYIGPEDTLRHFLDGAVVTGQDLVCDQSPFTLNALLPEQMRRLRFMLDRSPTAGLGG
jgi:hypothetical protein